MATDYIESDGVKDVIGVKLIGANSQIVDSATLAEQQAQTALLDLIKQNTTGLVKNDKEIPFVWFSVKQAFTDVTTDDIVVCYSIINTETGVGASYTKRWRGWIDVTVPAPIFDYLVFEGGNAMTFAQFQSVFGNTSDPAATDPTASSTAIQLFKAIFKWTKGARGAGNVDADTQRVAVATSPSPAVNSMAVTATSTESSFAFDANTSFILVSNSEVDCWVKVGASPVTATIGGAGCRQIFAGSTYVIPVTPGHKIAVIGPAFAAGYLTVDERQ